MNQNNLVEIYTDTIQRFYGKNIESYKHTHCGSKISVYPMDTVSALIELTLQKKSVGTNMAVLNMANSKTPGGGVVHGARAQEECLFRCSNLYQISSMYYPIEENEIIWSKNVSFIKDFNYKLIDPILCDVITLPAINLNQKADNYSSTPEYKQIMISKIHHMCQLAMKNNINTLILGAWGCGVFNNEPRVIASMFKEVLSLYQFEVIFAIINDHNSVDNNLEIFKEILL
jgi:uncharacterized protein (TIGR02452 family)